MVNEIGSEFWITSTQRIEEIHAIPEWICKFGKPVLTSSGRGAISLLLKDRDIKTKTVLMPAYSCNSVIQPFLEQGYEFYFYDINKDLTPNLNTEEISKDLGVFLHMGYFGFPTNENLSYIAKYLKDKSTIIVEDVTHTLFSNYKRFEENDYYVASLRKWAGMPSGGFLASPTRALKYDMENNFLFADTRKEALFKKSYYMRVGNEVVKEQYLRYFNKGEEILDLNVAPYHIDNLSKIIINNLDVIMLKEKRRENFKILLEGLVNIENIEPIFTEIPGNISPIFFPVYIKEKRSEIRNMFIEKNIYCPIHWPMPEIVKTSFNNTFEIYNTVLSIPCDQRYGEKDMNRVINELKRYIKYFKQSGDII